MNVVTKGASPSEDAITRLRAKLEDGAHTVFEEGPNRFLACRVKGEKIEMLTELERLSEYIDRRSVGGLEAVVLISDRGSEVLPGGILEPKLETKEKDDHNLYLELREKLTKNLSPIVFTTENDILELYRTGVRLEGSLNRTDVSIGLDLAKADLPKEGDLVYLIFDDGHRKLPLREVEALIDNALRSVREGSITKGTETKTPSNGHAFKVLRPSEAIDRPAIDLTDPKVLAREFSREVISLGYRKDAVFSRNDANQFFFIGMNLPAIFFKMLVEDDELSSFLRVLSHRRDALGILITKEWTPELEALSHVHNFIYLEAGRAHKAHEVVMALLRKGGTK
jgi:hypothetical protein